MESLEVQIDSESRNFVQRKNGKRYYEKECDYCTNHFFPKREGQKYCSPSCNVRACRKRNNYPISVQPIQEKESIEGLHDAIKDLKHSSYINKTEVLAASAAGNIITEIVKDAGKSIFGIKSNLEKDIIRIENDVKEIKKNTKKILEESLKLEPTGRKEEVLTLRSSKKVVLVEFHDNKGNVFYTLESVTDSNYFPPY